MSQYHFAELAFSDNVVVAEYNAPEKKDMYKFEYKTYPNIQIPNRGLAMSLAFKAEDSNEVRALQTAVNEYNEYLAKLQDVPGFNEWFVKHGLCVSKKEVAKQWSEEFADFVFSRKDYCFTTELVVEDDYLFDHSCPVNYQAVIDGTTVILPIGATAKDYPVAINGKKAIWNWVNNGHDFCFSLWELLGERSKQNEENEEDEGVQYYFEVYDQIRSEPVEPQLANVFRHLQNAGYIQTYTIKPNQEDPRWNYYGKTDGSIDLALVDTSFLKDDLLMKQVEYLLWEPLDKEYVHIEVTCDSEKEDKEIFFGYGIERKKYRGDQYIDTGAIAEGISDFFSENAQEYESGIMKAKKLIDEGSQTEIKTALFEIFGHFQTTFLIDGMEKESDQRHDIEGMIYDVLEDVYTWF